MIGASADADIRLDDAAFHLAAADRVRADVAEALDRMAGWAARLPVDLADPAARGDSLARLLAGDEGLTGDRDSYDAPENADLLAVMKRRLGLPVALAILYVALARRVGWQAAPLGLPGHVLVVLGKGGGAAMIDPFADGVPVDRAGLIAICRRALGSARIEPHHVQRLGNRDTLVRLVMNQASRAQRQGDPARALTLFRRLTLIAPASSGLWWERARLERDAGDRAAARASLAAMLETTREPALIERIRAAVDALAR